MLTHRLATPDDAALLGQLNKQLIQDQGHRNPMSIDELSARMHRWLTEETYQTVLFMLENEAVGYALYHQTPDHIHLRQFFIARNHRRQGHGRAAMRLLLHTLWPPDLRIRLDVLTTNKPAHAFYRAVGFNDYCTTMERPPVQ